MSRYKEALDSDRFSKEAVHAEFVEWCEVTFNMPKESVKKFMEVMEYLHGYQPISFRKIMLRVKFAQCVEEQGIDNALTKIKELAWDCDVSDEQVRNLRYRDNHSIIETIHWKQTIS